MRTVNYIDASNMSEKEICELLKIPYVPTYKSSLFWSIVLLSLMPQLVLLCVHFLTIW